MANILRSPHMALIYRIHSIKVIQIGVEGLGQIVAYVLLCKQCMKSVDHLFVHCLFTLRLREKAKVWLGINELHTKLWVDLSFPDWWNMMSSEQTAKQWPHSLCWEIWNDLDDNKHTPSEVVFNKITRES
jgi:hypothetical protein